MKINNIVGQCENQSAATENTKCDSAQETTTSNLAVSPETTELETGDDPAPTNTSAPSDNMGGVDDTGDVPEKDEIHAERQPDSPEILNQPALEGKSASPDDIMQPPGDKKDGEIVTDPGDGRKSKTSVDSGSNSRTGKKKKPKKLTWPGKAEGKPCPWETMNGKPVIYRKVKTVLTFDNAEFRHKLLCDIGVLNLGDACPFDCTYCYVERATCGLDAPLIKEFNRAHGTDLGFQDVVIRRENSIAILESQLNEQNDKNYDIVDGVIFTSSLVDPAGNMTLLKETVAACLLILEKTKFRIRILSKCTLLNRIIEEEMIPKRYHDRLILGYSIGTLDDKLAGAIEIGTSLPSKRIEALHRLQDLGISTFGMICPNLPQKDYIRFSKEICEAIRVDKCMHVWAEALNIRGKNRDKTIKALTDAGFKEEAALLKSVMVDDVASTKWEEYARETYEAHLKHIPAEKLRFLQYVKKDTADWWADRRDRGAVPLGTEAETRQLLAGGQSAPVEPLPELTAEDVQYRQEREVIVSAGIKASILASKALYEIYSYQDGLLWKKDYQNFEHYIKAKWDYESAHGYRLVKAGKVLGALEDKLSNADNGEPPVELPRNECQLRALMAKVPEDHLAECWKHIAVNNGPDKLTGSMVERLAKEYLTKHKVELAVPTKRSSPRPKVDPSQLAITTIDSLSEVLGKLPNPERFEELLAQLRTLIKQAASGKTLNVDAKVTGESTMQASESPYTPNDTDGRHDNSGNNPKPKAA